MKAAKVETPRALGAVNADDLSLMLARHPLAALGYDFDVPLLDGDHVTDDTGTGFVHTAPGHGADDYIIWMSSGAELKERGIDPTIPFTVDADGVLTKDARASGTPSPHRKGRQGRRQRRGDQGAQRSRQRSSRADG